MFVCGNHGFKYQGQFMTDSEWNNMIIRERNSEKGRMLSSNYQMQYRMEAEARMNREKDPMIKEMMRQHIEMGDYGLYKIFGLDEEDLKG